MNQRTHGPLIATRNVMGTSGLEVTRATFTNTDCHDSNKENSEDNCHDNDSVVEVTEKDFVKEWLWRRSDRSFSYLPGIVRDRASSKSLQSSNAIHKLPQSCMVQGLEKPMEGHNLNFMLSRMESRTPEQKSWTPSDYGSYYSQRSLLNPYTKEQCHWSAYCKVFVVVSLIVLLAWGIAVPLYFTVGPGTLPWNTEKMSADSEAKMAKVIGNTRPTGIVFNGVNCSMRIINQPFTHSLQNKYSSEFQSLRLKIESALSAVFQSDNHFNKVVITSFSPGSIVVRFAVLFKKKRPDVKEYTHHVLVNYIMTHWSMLSTFRVDLSSIQVAYISNKCAEANGGCSHICVWTLLGDGYECHCPSGYVLMSDEKTCFAAVLDMALLRSNPIPCGATHYQCPNGSCIPQQWVCDGVPDCQMGEDENSSICSERVHIDLPKMPIALPQQQEQKQQQEQEEKQQQQLQQELEESQQQQQELQEPQQKQQEVQREPQQNPQILKTYTTQFSYETSTKEYIEDTHHDRHQRTGDITTKANSSMTLESQIPDLEKPKLTTAENIDVLGLGSDLNGSKLKDNGKIKDLKPSSPLRWFKFFGR